MWQVMEPGTGDVVEYRFGGFNLLPAERRLLAGGEPCKLGSRAFDTLLVLVETRDRAVPKADLLARVWPGLVVEENNLQVQVAALRKLLGPAAIATIPGRGYRFTLPVETIAARTPGFDAGAAAANAVARPPRHNVPERLAALYGRDAELAHVLALLDEHTMVSIVGAGGIGKTRLAEAVAHARRDAYADGTWIVELAALSDPALVPAEVARVLDLHQGAADASAVGTALAHQSLLLVLDNCEHLLDAVAALVDTLTRQAPGVRLLVTSQEPLKTSAEHVFRLDPLAIPQADHDAAGERCGAVQLFARRAEAADPRFVLDAETLPAVLEICRRLDGIPLALELAAARVPLLGVEGLRARLDERFHVLTGGSRLLLRRHQTLRAALDFSHGLLSDAERAVFRRLGVFAGTFAVEQAEAVCTGDDVPAADVLQALGALVDKSLVLTQGRASRRLRLLETTRAYALEKLADAGETRATLERHARAVAGLFRPAYDAYWTMRQDEWLARFQPELDNLRAALEWSLRHAPPLAIELMGDSLKLWHDLALQPEALRHCDAALAHVTKDTPARTAGRLWYAVAMMCANTWNARSLDAARRAVPLLRAAGDEPVLALALARMTGSVHTGPRQEQWDALAELEQLVTPEWPGQLRWAPHYARAVLSRSTERFEDARREYARACAIAEELGQRGFALRVRTNWAEMVAACGDLDAAIRLQRENVRDLAACGDRLFQTFAAFDLVRSLLLRGDVAAAREPFAAAVPLALRYDVAYRAAATAALLVAHLGDLPLAGRLLGCSRSANIARGEQGPDSTERPAVTAALALLAGVPAEELEAWMRAGEAASVTDLFRAALDRAGNAAERMQSIGTVST